MALDNGGKYNLRIGAVAHSLVALVLNTIVSAHFVEQFEANKQPDALALGLVTL